MTPAQLFAAAQDRFSKSIAAATVAGNTAILNAARVGRARALMRQGKKTEAHKLLSDVYNWFTEGFDTKDLQEAKGLLNELEGKGGD